MKRIIEILENHLENEYEMICEYGPGKNDVKVKEYIALAKEMLKLKLIDEEYYNDLVECINNEIWEVEDE